MSESPADHGGLHRPDVRRERTDVDTKAIMTFVAGLAGGIAIVMLALWGLFNLFSRQEQVQKKSAYPLAAREREETSIADRLPPPPRLEGLGREAATTAWALIEAQEATLQRYEWANAEKTAARIPIDEAIKRLGKPGALPARNDGRPVDEFLAEPSETSSGQRPRGQKP